MAGGRVSLRAGRFLLVGMLALCLPGVLAGSASALPVLLGNGLYYAGGDVGIDVYQNESAFTEQLYLFSVDPDFPIALNTQVGTHVTLTAAQLAAWGISMGDEMIFGIHVQNTGYDYFTGPASRNPDNALHANVTDIGGGVYDVGFEDLYGGGDQDYNDTVFRFTGVTLPEPSTLMLLLPGLAGLLWHRRGHSR